MASSSRSERRLARSIERDRRAREARHHREDLEDEDVTETLIKFGFGGVIVVGLVLAGLSWLDGQFGWAMRPAVEEWLRGVL